MPDDRLSDETWEIVERYHRNVARALFDYLKEGRGRRLRGDRDGDRLILTFVLEEADEFHSRLQEYNQHPEGDPPDRSKPGEPGG